MWKFLCTFKYYLLKVHFTIGALRTTAGCWFQFQSKNTLTFVHTRSHTLFFHQIVCWIIVLHFALVCLKVLHCFIRPLSCLRFMTVFTKKIQEYFEIFDKKMLFAGVSIEWCSVHEISFLAVVTVAVVTFFSLMKIFSSPQSDPNAPFSLVGELVTWRRMSRPLMCQCQKKYGSEWRHFVHIWVFFPKLNCFHHQFSSHIKVLCNLGVMETQLRSWSWSATSNDLPLLIYLYFYRKNTIALYSVCTFKTVVVTVMLCACTLFMFSFVHILYWSKYSNIIVTCCNENKLIHSFSKSRTFFHQFNLDISMSLTRPLWRQLLL